MVSKLRFSWKENLKKCADFEEEKGRRHILGNIFFGTVVFSCFSFAKQYVRFLLIYVPREIKGFYQSSLGNEVDYTNIMNVSQNILAKN